MLAYFNALVILLPLCCTPTDTIPNVLVPSELEQANSDLDPSFLYDEGSGESETVDTPVDGSENANVTCLWLKTCHLDNECGTGQCVGASNKCNCAACAPLTPCTNDTQCGGLRHACDKARKVCDCTEGILRNGFKDLLTGIVQLCGNMDCKLYDSESCFGLPCVSGICLCVPKAASRLQSTQN